MPEHADSIEARWLAENYDQLAERYEGQWVAVAGEEIVQAAESAEGLAALVDGPAQRGEVLIARVFTGRVG